MLTVLQGFTLIVATMTTGMMAGVFLLYAYAIMPGLRSTDDRTFVGAFQSIDRSIINPLFLSTFLGALLSTGVATILHIPSDTRSVLPWTAAAFVLYLAAFVISVRVNVPLNDVIKAAGHPARIADLAEVRRRFSEARWVRWNIVRAVATTIASGLLVGSIIQYGRTLGSGV